jgi:hypothetical protein
MIGICGTVAILALVSACAPSTSSPNPVATDRAVNYGMITPGPTKVVGDLSMVIEAPPFPYGAPLPPPIATNIDGLYTRELALDGTPTPCKRCAGYRLEGGEWTLYFNRGIYKVFHQLTDFESVGSYTVSGNQLTLFNDPYCEEDLAMKGAYTFAVQGSTLRLKVVGDDLCSIHLRAKNLTATVWSKKGDAPNVNGGPCQPPNREAAISDHWNKPPECK